MRNAFLDARLKIDRANKHIADFDAAILAMKQRNPPVFENNPDTGLNELRHGIPDFADSARQFSCIIGDAVHNLRAALEFAWVAVLDKNRIAYDPKHASFPVRDTLEELETALNGLRIRSACPELHRRLVTEIQPYKLGINGIIWAIHDMDISDKHLLVLGIRPMYSASGILVKNKGRKSVEVRTWLHQEAGTLIIPFADGIEMQDSGELTFHVTVEEAGIFKGLDASHMLFFFSKFVLHVVNRLETI